uniref:Hexosyltransferase n=1 Tax=Caenorhabditis japonica TaxID=281687 RepID=A0A8R1I187_CAEJA
MMAIYGYVIDQLPSVDQIVVTNDDTIVNATALEQVFSQTAWASNSFTMKDLTSTFSTILSFITTSILAILQSI